MTEKEDPAVQRVNDKPSEVPDSDPRKDGNDIYNSEEERERHLRIRNEEGHKMDAGRTIPDSVPGVMTAAAHGTNGETPAGLEVHGVDTNSHDPDNENLIPDGTSNPVKKYQAYLSKKSEKKKQEEKNWEEIGDEDLIGDAHGKCGTKRLFWKGSLDSQGCPTASSVEVKDILRYCILVLGAYGDDRDGLVKAIEEHDPQFDREGVVDFQHPTGPGACPPYFIYVDHKHREVSMHIRGLNLLHRQDYIALLSNRKGEKSFDGGYVHHGMFGPAEWAVKHAGPVLKEHLLSNEGYRLTLVGHSLGAGVAGLLAMALVKDTEVVGGISPDRISAFLFAPPRVMSLDLAIKYAPYINSVIYQDDFLPRVSTQSVKRLFLTTFAFTGPVVFIFWLKQAFSSKHAKDVRRLYPPGKIYHFVYKQPGRPGHHHPIRARVVASSQGRFERLVLSSSGTTSNHFILTLTNHLKTYNWPQELKDPWLTSVLETKK